MSPRGEVALQVTFGPSKSPLASRAVSYARAHAKEAAEVAPGAWRASFPLGPDERTFGIASALLQMVLGWRSTTVEADGSPEDPWVTGQMLRCAREWLRGTGACRAYFPAASGWPKCHACPLYDAGWAAESALPPVIPFLLEPEGCLKTAPRGYPKDHPRIEFLRYKGLITWREWPAGAWLGTRKARERVVGFLRLSAPLNACLRTHVGPSTLPERRR